MQEKTIERLTGGRRQKGLTTAEELRETPAAQILAADPQEPKRAEGIVGRPPAITQKVLQQLEVAFGYGASDREACLYAGIAESTLYLYCATHPEFSERKEALKQKPLLKARESVVKAFATRPELALRYLEDKKSDEFNPKNTTRHEGEVQINFSAELRERTKKYEPEIQTPDVPKLEG